MTLSYDRYPSVLKAINLISQGRTKTYACDEANITIPMFEDFVAKDPSLEALYVDAERRGYDAMADALLSVHQNKQGDPYGDSDPKVMKVISDNIKWVLSKRDTKRFGEKIEVKHEITMDRAITDALDAARARAIAGKTIDLDATEYRNTAAPLIGQVIDVVIDEDAAILAELLS